MKIRRLPKPIPPRRDVTEQVSRHLAGRPEGATANAMFWKWQGREERASFEAIASALASLEAADAIWSIAVTTHRGVEDRLYFIPTEDARRRDRASKRRRTA